MEKDPYLSELDAMDDLESPTQVEGMAPAEPVQPGEEKTHIDVKVPLSAPPVDPPDIASSAPVQEILDLSPDISVPLVIVMGRKNYTVKDLLALRMGQVMEMDRAPLEPVDIVAAGKVIGKGELVDVEGKLGVRILKLLK